MPTPHIKPLSKSVNIFESPPALKEEKTMTIKKRKAILSEKTLTIKN